MLKKMSDKNFLRIFFFSYGSFNLFLLKESYEIKKMKYNRYKNKYISTKT